MGSPSHYTKAPSRTTAHGPLKFTPSIPSTLPNSLSAITCLSPGPPKTSLSDLKSMRVSSQARLSQTSISRLHRRSPALVSTTLVSALATWSLRSLRQDLLPIQHAVESGTVGCTSSEGLV